MQMQMHSQYSPDQVEAYFYGNPRSVGERILFIKRESQLAEYEAHLSDVHAFGNVWHGLAGSFRGQHISYSGTCGGLAEGLEIGDYVVADRAVCGDGYSLHLGHPPFSRVAGDPERLESLENQLASRVERVDRGLTFTTSSVVREVDPDFWESVDEECRAIEMGAAA
jgi:nucleoside phosphorylase